MSDLRPTSEKPGAFMLGFFLITGALAIAGVGCVALAGIAREARNLDADGEVLWPAKDRSWG